MLPLTNRGPTADPLPRRHFRTAGLGCSRFARHYFGNHSLFSSPQGTEMFHFPWFAPSALFIQAEVTRLFAAPGFPIRTSPAQRSVGNSPELFAATHVLHRLLAPRHPPHALSSLLASISLWPASRRDCRNSRPRPRPRLFAADPKESRLLESPAPPSPAASRRLVASAGVELLSKIENYPSYALVKERFQPLAGNLAQLLGPGWPRATSLPSWEAGGPRWT